ncbi:MAG: pilus assembly protein PilM, partial [Planctomycetota bacterium]|nr:pilus assembly protein PilM [Planctomycetota bacterium]
TVIDAEKYWIRNLPIAGNDITKAIAKKFQIPFDEADKLKITAAQSQQANKIFAVIQPVLRDLVGEIHRSLGHYKSLAKSVKFEKMLIVGNSSKTLNFQKYLSQNLQMDVQRLSKLGRISVSSKVNDATLQKQLPSLGVCLGLAIQGLGLASNKINLLPPERLAKKAMSLKKPYVVGAAAALALSVGALYMDATKDVDSLTTCNSRLQDLTGKMDMVRGNVSASKDMKTLDMRLAIIASCAGERDTVLTMLNKLNELLPDTSLMTDEQKADKIWLLEFSVKEITQDKEVDLEAAAGPSAVAAEPYRGPKPFVSRRLLQVTAEFGVHGEAGKTADATTKWKDKVVFPFAQAFGLSREQVTLLADPPEPISMLRSRAEEAAAKAGGGALGPGPDTGEKKYFRLVMMTNDPIPVSAVEQEEMRKKLAAASAPAEPPKPAEETPK